MEKLNVYIGDRLVGALARYKDKYAFEYDKEWLKDGYSISPFSLPLKEGVFIPKNNVFNGLFGVFADSLPDSWGNLLSDRFIRKQGIKDVDLLTKLSIVGSSGMGALEYKPNNEMKDKLQFDLDKYQEEANKILNQEEANIDYLFKFGGSSGGARPKVLVNIDNCEWLIKFESKFDFKNFGLSEYEYALACKEIGINMPDVKLFKSKTNKGYFGIKRFDRTDDLKRIHMISASALLEIDFRGPTIDYLNLFKLTKILTNGNKNDLEQLFLRMCFNVYAHNLDDHAKNFSYLYDPKFKKYVLSPAYDMTYSNTYIYEHTSAVNNKGKDILDSDLIAVGKNFDLDMDFMLKSIDKVKNIVNKRLNKYLKR